MERVATVPRKRRKSLRKREYAKYVRFLRKQLRRRSGIEVKPARQWEDYLKRMGIFDVQAMSTDTLQADAFWKNYATAQEWQNRHNISWWRSRCISLERENEILQNKVKSLTHHKCSSSTKKNYMKHFRETESDGDLPEEAAANCNNEGFELNITEDLLDFLETSERHKREMQERRKLEEKADRKTLKSAQKTVNKKESRTSVILNTENIQARREEAELLYGDAAPKILAMETALLVAANRYKDTSNAQYWPNIPFNP